MREYYEPRTIEELEYLYTDPAVTDAIASADELAKQLNRIDTPSDRVINSMQNMADAAWPFMKSRCEVSGTLYPGVLNKVGQSIIPGFGRDYTEQIMISDGFFFPQVVNTNERSPEKNRFVTALGYIALRYDEAGQLMAGIPVLSPPDEILVQYQDRSAQLSARYLQVLRPELKASIDEAIVTHPNIDKQLNALSKVTFCAPGGSDESGELKDVETYVNTLLEFDQELPYRVESTILEYQSAPSGKTAVNGWLSRIKVRTRVRDEATSNKLFTYGFMLDAVMHAAHSSEPATKIELPLENISLIRALRRK